MKTRERMFNNVIMQWKIYWFTSLTTSLYAHYTNNENVRSIRDIQSLWSSAKKVTAQYQVFSKLNLVHTESAFPVVYTAKTSSVNMVVAICVHRTFWFQKENFLCCQTKKFQSLKVPNSKLQNSLRFPICSHFICIRK